MINHLHAMVSENKLKRWFITSFIMLNGISSFMAVTEFFCLYTLAWFGAVLSSLPITIFFIRLFVAPVSQTTKHLWPLTGIIALGFLITFSQVIHGDANGFVMSLATMNLSGWLFYNYWYANTKVSNLTLDVGDKLPNITLQDEHGQAIHSKSFSADFTLLLFFRGNWCPICMAQVQEVADNYQQLLARNIEVILVSAQSHEMTQKLANKLDIDFTFAVDVNSAVAKQLNIYVKDATPAGFELLDHNKDGVMPTILIVNRENKIVFFDVADNYRVRPTPENFLAVIDNLQH